MLATALLVALLAGVGGAVGPSSALLIQGGAAPASRQVDDTLRQRAESLLAAGELAAARRIAEALDDRRPDDPRTLILLGRVFLAWPTFGRFQADTLFTRAARLAPGDPQPLYYLGQTGLALGGDDGEMIARRGLVPVLAIEPEYRDAWTLWTKLYRGDEERRDVIAALARHDGHYKPDCWRAQMLLEQGETAQAIALLERLVSARPDDPAPRAWLAQALFVAGRDAEGTSAYADALLRARDDTGDVLWRQVRGIASPSEQLAWERTAPEARAVFFRAFWAQREPDLATPINERFAEHFRRLADARRRFGLLHPNSRYFRSATFRALSVGGLAGRATLREKLVQEEALGFPSEVPCEARLTGPRRGGAAAGPGDPATQPPNLEDGLDDRGRVFLRHGPPDYQFSGRVGNLTWCYYRPDGRVLRVTFASRTSNHPYGFSGDMIVTPLWAGEAASAADLLATDRFDLKSDLAFAFWSAPFRAADQRQTVLYVLPDSLSAVAALIDTAGVEVARDSATDRPLRLVAPPGRYSLLLDTRRGERVGRYRASVPLPDFVHVAPTVSGILLASGDVPPVRDSVAVTAPHGLALPASLPLRVYAELYDLGRGAGVTRYVAEYRFERVGGGPARRREPVTTIAFRREAPFAPRLIESLVVDPGRLPSGRYRLQLQITDEVRGVRTVSPAVEFVLR
jgi:tetratricopeptide (TPR) repeat protein